MSGFAIFSSDSVLVLGVVVMDILLRNPIGLADSLMALSLAIEFNTIRLNRNISLNSIHHHIPFQMIPTFSNFHLIM